LRTRPDAIQGRMASIAPYSPQLSIGMRIWIGESWRVGYLKTAFERKPETPEAAKEPPATPEEQKKRDEQKKRGEAMRARAEYDRKYNDAALAKLREMGVESRARRVAEISL